MHIYHDTPIRLLNLSTQAPATLADAGITTVGQLVAKARIEVASLHGMGKARLAAIDEALSAHGLEFDTTIEHHPMGSSAMCTACPACETCGNPRATEARNVVTDHLGRAAHVGFRWNPPCEDCQAHHRQLVTDAAKHTR